MTKIPSVRQKLAALRSKDVRMRVIPQNNMADSEHTSELVTEAILEDKLVDIWPEYPCLYDVRSSDFKNRDLRDNALQEMAEKLGQTGQ